MSSLGHHIRTRYHPLHQARKLRAARALIGLVDVPVWGRLPGVRWKVRVRLVRHASYLLLRGTPEPEIAALFLALARLLEPRTVWDVGANFGYYSWLLKSRDPGVEAHVFEPDDDNVALIQATRSRNALQGVHVVPAAVSSSVGHALFNLDAVAGATGSLEPGDASYAKRHFGIAPAAVPVPTVSLDAYGQGVETVDLVKIDVEGHEAEVLRGASSLLERSAPALVFECFQPRSPALSFLRERDYTLLDAERLSPDLSRATNFVALPRTRGTPAEALQRLVLEERRGLERRGR